MSAKLMPLGPRVLIEDIEPLDDLTARAAKAGIHAVVFENNKPRPTTGKVVALGSDPIVQEQLKEGDIVFFSKHAGTHTIIEGKSYRTLDFHEITNVLRTDEATE